MQEERGSQWDIMMTALIEGRKYMDVNSYCFRDELSTMHFLDRNSKVSDSLGQWLSKLNEFRLRTTELTTRYRNKGNEVYRDIQRPDDIAADYYTQAIFSAPKESVDLALAHANRAASCLRGGLFIEEAYFDCKLALQFNYPLEKRKKLLERKIELCWLSEQEAKEERISETIQEIKKLSKTNIFSEIDLKLQQRREQFEKWKSEKESTKEAQDQENVFFQGKKLIEQYNPSVGRFITAGESIENNQPILREKAFAFVPVYHDYRPDTIFYHCQNCALVNCLPFPCYDCARVTYCSPVCLAKHEPIHKYECTGYQKNLWMKIGIAHLALRSLLVGFRDGIAKLIDLKEGTPQQVWMKLMSINEPNFAYGNVLGLVTNFEKMDPKDCLRYALTAKMLTTYLAEYTDYFTDLPNLCNDIMVNKDDWKMLVAAVIMKHMGQLVSNGHAISDIELIPPSLHGKTYHHKTDHIFIDDLHLVMSINRIFTAIFPKISLLNHSCDPNIQNSFDGPFLTIIAARNIAKDEEVLNCYGPNYKLMSKAERQSALQQQYCFKCKCNKCINDDETYEKYYEYICPNDKCRAPLQMESIDRQWWLEVHNKQLSDLLTPKFGCTKCNHRLALHPKSLREFLNRCNEFLDPRGFSLFRSDTTQDRLIKYYMSVTICLGKYHELRMKMAQALLTCHNLARSLQQLRALAYAAMDNYAITRERYGQFSLEVVIATTYALNIIQSINKLTAEDKSHSTRMEVEQILKNINVKQMEKSYTILSKSMQMIFNNALGDLNNKPPIEEDVKRLQLDSALKELYQ